MRKDHMVDGNLRTKHATEVIMYNGVKRYTRLKTDAIIIPVNHRKVGTLEATPLDGTFLAILFPCPSFLAHGEGCIGTVRCKNLWENLWDENFSILFLE